MRHGAWAAIAAIWIVMVVHALIIRLYMLAPAVPAGAARGEPRRHPRATVPA